MNRLFKLLLKVFIVIIVLIVVLYFIITAPFFIRKVILPIVGHQIKGTVTVDSIEVSPLKSRIAFTNLSLQTETINAKVKTFEADFKLFALFSNNVIISKLALEDSYISIVSNQEESTAPKTEKDKQATTASKEEINLNNLNIKDVRIANFNIKYSALRSDASLNTVSEIKNFNLEVPYFETSGKAMADFSSDIVTSTSSDTLSGNLKGKMFAELNEKTFPKELVLNSLLNLGKDSSPINVKFDSSEESGRTPFSMSANLSKLPLQPFFQTFLTGAYKKTDGYIDSFDLVANGSDLATVSSLDGVNGTMNLAVSNVYVPANLDHNPIIGLILLPLDVISNLDKNISSEAFSKQSANVLSSSKGAVSGTNIIEFKSGVVNALMTDGNIDIKKFIFSGTPKSAVKSMDITGIINKDQSIDINTSTNIGGLTIPIHITGTISDPKPDTINLVNSMLKNTANTIGNIIDAASKNGSGNNTTKSIMNAVDSFTGNSSADGGDSVGSLINSFKNIGK
ncbi:MAG: hypothetical protein WCR55_02345 [Lentisphaerota bacterium]